MENGNKNRKYSSALLNTSDRNSTQYLLIHNTIIAPFMDINGHLQMYQICIFNVCPPPLLVPLKQI